MSANPPPSAPMLSPDHKWVWDGSQWQPIADPENAAHESVLPAYNTVTRDLPVPVADARPIPGPPPMSVSAPVPLNVSRPQAGRSRRAQPSPVLWNQPPTGLNKYLYATAAGLVVLIGLVIVFQVAGFSLPFGRSTGSSQAPVTDTGPPLTSRSESASADRYMKGIIAPAVAGLNDTLAILDRGCHGSLTVSCSSTVAPTDRAIKNFVSAIDGSVFTVPACIATAVAKMRRDAAGMDANLNLMLTAFDQNDLGSVNGYYLRYENGHAALVADLAAMPQLEQAACNTDVTGP